MFRNCFHFNGEQGFIGTYAKKIKRGADAAIERSKRTHPHLWGLRELLAAADRDDENAAFHAAAETDPCVMGYVHWTFPDQTVEDQRVGRAG